MFRVNTLAAAALVALGLLTAAPASGQEFKGQLKVGVHKVKLQADTLYQLLLDAPRESTPLVDVPQGRLSIVIGKTPADDKIFFVPDKAEEYTFYVYPYFGGIKTGTVDYTLTFKALPFSPQPVLKEQNKWTDQDPTYADRKTPYKAFKVPMKANKVYVIELTRGKSNPKVEPFLYLEGLDGNIVQTNDAAGSERPARIVFVPQKDGEYRILASMYHPMTGDFVLQVRTVAEGTVEPKREQK